VPYCVAIPYVPYVFKKILNKKGCLLKQNLPELLSIIWTQIIPL
jgi:hypothetical protein